MSAPVASCQNHPSRDAIGLCVRCRSRVCSECSTKVDGINYCGQCLAGLAVIAQQGGRAAGAARAQGAGRLYLAAASQFAVLWATLWLLLETLLAG